MYHCRNGVIIFTMVREVLGGDVSLQEWCDYFHNSPRGPLHPDDTESSLVYKAAFLALWLCSYVGVTIDSCLHQST
jgi:hypothetical protein